MYAQEMGRIADDPYGAALTEPKLWAASPKSANGSITGCDGKNGAKWAFLKGKISSSTFKESGNYSVTQISDASKSVTKLYLYSKTNWSS